MAKSVSDIKNFENYGGIVSGMQDSLGNYYTINAEKLDGHTYEDIISKIAISIRNYSIYTKDDNGAIINGTLTYDTLTFPEGTETITVNFSDINFYGNNDYPSTIDGLHPGDNLNVLGNSANSPYLDYYVVSTDEAVGTVVLAKKTSEDLTDHRHTTTSVTVLTSVKPILDTVSLPTGDYDTDATFKGKSATIPVTITGTAHNHGVSDPGHDHGFSANPHSHTVTVNETLTVNGINDTGHTHHLSGSVTATYAGSATEVVKNTEIAAGEGVGSTNDVMYRAVYDDGVFAFAHANMQNISSGTVTPSHNFSVDVGTAVLSEGSVTLNKTYTTKETTIVGTVAKNTTGVTSQEASLTKVTGSATYVPEGTIALPALSKEDFVRVTGINADGTASVISTVSGVKFS